MTTGADLIASFQRQHYGRPSTLSMWSRELIKDKLLPKSSGRSHAKYGPREAAILMLTIMAGPSCRTSAACVRMFMKCKNDQGEQILPRLTRMITEIWRLNDLSTESVNLLNSSVTLVRNTTEIRFEQPNSPTEIFNLTGDPKGNQEAIEESVTITGKFIHNLKLNLPRRLNYETLSTFGQK